MYYVAFSERNFFVFSLTRALSNHTVYDGCVLHKHNMLSIPAVFWSCAKFSTQHAKYTHSILSHWSEVKTSTQQRLKMIIEFCRKIGKRFKVNIQLIMSRIYSLISKCVFVFMYGAECKNHLSILEFDDNSSSCVYVLYIYIYL